MGRLIKWVAIIAAIVILGIVVYHALIFPILERGWHG